MEFQAVGDKIKRAWKDFGIHDKARKHGGYKEKRLNELETYWKEFAEIDEKLEEASGKREAGLETFLSEVEGVYAKYKDALMLLPDKDPKNNQDEEKERRDNENGNDTERALFAKQEVRTEGLKRILNQIADKNDQLSLAFCKIKMKTLQTYWERILIAHEELAAEVSQLPPHYMDEIELLEIQYEETLIILQEVLENTHGDNLKLPRVTIPKFEGDYFNWINFKELFTSMVIENKSLSEAQRMQMLKTSLVEGGEAEGLIKDLNLAPNSFKTAWERLKKRYENEKVIVNKYLKKVNNATTHEKGSWRFPAH